jgi:Replication-relaxation
VLEILAEYFCLRTNDVAAIQRNRIPTEHDKRTIRRTLSLLYQEGLAYRLPYFDLDEENGARTFVYGLSAKGHAFALDNDWASHSCKPFDEHSQRTLDHELEISSFHAALKTFCIQSGLGLYWQQKDLKRTVTPDALFAITDPRQPEDRDTLYYFLEIERAKIGNMRNGEPSILRKLRKYYEYYGSAACERDWEDFRQFRVIVIQRSEARRQYLLRTLEGSFAHRMFWLTTESAYHRDIGSPIFLTPPDYKARVRSLLPVQS